MRRRHVPVLVLAVLLLASGGVAATADNRDDLVDQQQANQTQLEQLASSLEGTRTDLQTTYLALEATRQQLPVAEQQLRVAEEQLAAAERVQQQTADRLAVAEEELVALASEISDARGQIERSQQSLGELARTTYQNGTSLSPLSLAFGSGSTADFLTQYSAMDSAVRSQTSVLTDMSALEATARNAQARQAAVTERVTELKAQADQAVADADTARDAAAAKRAEIVRLKAQQEALAGELEGQASRIEQEQTEIQQANAEIAQEIARIDEENRRKAEEERLRQLELDRQAELARQAEAERLAQLNSSRSDPAPAAPAAPAVPVPPVATAALGTPIPAPLYVTSPYGYRVYPITGGWYMHYGVDLRSACGNQQYAVASGTVADVRPAYNNGTHGNQVIVNNGMINGSSYVTVYNHLSSFAVKKGQSVSKGQVIAYTGATGNVTGCHVHFEVWKNGTTIDPMTLPGY